MLDLRNRIVDLDPAAKRLVGLPDPKVIGRPVVQALGDYAELAGPLRDTNMIQSEIVLERNDAREYYDLQISPLTSPFGDPIGRLVVLHNITGRPGRLSLLVFNIAPD